MTRKRVCVFCGSAPGARAEYLEAARVLGAHLAHSGSTLVYGGGRTGLMGALADAALQAGGEVIGAMPKPLVDKEVAHTGLSRLHVVASMHERKALMADLADAFLALPGAFGTLDELCEILCWGQLGFHEKPVGLWNVGGYWEPLRALFDHATEEGFLKPQHRNIALIDDSLERLLQRMDEYQPVHLEKWWERR
ncbi:MAG: TIGR00730 family Rossman fold protein [Bryobacteraceae bacterium]